MNRLFSRGPLPLILAFLLLVCGVVVAGSDEAPEYQAAPAAVAPGCSGSAGVAVPAGFKLALVPVGPAPVATVAAVPSCAGTASVAAVNVQQTQRRAPLQSLRAKNQAARAARKATTASKTVTTAAVQTVNVVPAAVVPACQACRQ